jgi:hypothetical protein
MATKSKSKTKTASKRTKVGNLPKSSKSLSGKSMRKVKGGINFTRKAGEKPLE